MSTRRVDVMCVVCRDGLDSGSQTCLACSALYHEECLAGLRGRCATLGCRGLRPAQATPSSGRPGRLVLSAAQVAAASARPRPAAVESGRGDETSFAALVALVVVALVVVLASGLAGLIPLDQPHFEAALSVTGFVMATIWYVGKTVYEAWARPYRPASLTAAAITPAAITRVVATPAVVHPVTAIPPPAWTGTCVLCPSPTLVNRPVCRDHAALLDDPLGPTVRVRPRPGQLYGPGLVDEGLSRRPG